MITVTKPSDTRVDVELKGGIDANIMSAGLDRLMEVSEGMTGGTMLYTITEFEMPTIGALGIEFARIGQLFGLISKFDRCAVVSDSGWIRTAAEVEGALIPGMQIKAFEMRDRAAAETWLDTQPTESVPL
ncbi:MAG: STAS/SEC14 domain-containing protein [Pseudomonadota bacterium]